MAMHFSEAERRAAAQALDRLGLAHKALERAGTLSDGQQQRVAIARALVQKPRVMLAEEPIASLDPGNATRVMDALRRINREDGITVLVNLHTLDTARAYCDRIVAMRAGRVMFDGTARRQCQVVFGRCRIGAFRSLCAESFGHVLPEAERVSPGVAV